MLSPHNLQFQLPPSGVIVHKGNLNHVFVLVCVFVCVLVRVLFVSVHEVVGNWSQAEWLSLIVTVGKSKSSGKGNLNQWDQLKPS